MRPRLTNRRTQDIQTRAMRFNLIRFTPGIPIKMPVEGEVDTDVLLVNCDLPEAADSAAMDLIYSTRRLILYYTLEHDYCQDSDGSLKGQRIWTIVDKLTAHKLHAATATATSTRRISVTLTPVKAKSLSSELKKRQGDGESQEKNIWSSPAPSTSIALIILYSITGVITFLFLVIIIVGAVRAHRHPERYGPRGISRMGQPPQSRARGLARAVLDTIPIVRFGGTTAHPPTVKGDLEMQEGTDKMPDGTVYPINEGGSEETGRQERDAGGLSASPTPTIEQPECPVCMDEFQEGQELRVLPCSHQFHQACIDEWLLNIAGSCPLW